MPELPEVETTRRGIEPHLLGQRVKQLIIHDARLRWPIPASISALQGATIVYANMIMLSLYSLPALFFASTIRVDLAACFGKIRMMTPIRC